jgi:hypothetical protein
VSFDGNVVGVKVNDNNVRKRKGCLSGLHSPLLLGYLDGRSFRVEAS